MTIVKRPNLSSLPQKGSKRARRLKSLAQWAPLLLTLVAICVGIVEFAYQQSQNNRDEFRRQIWGKRLTAFSEIANELANVVKVANAGNTYSRDSLITAATRYDATHGKNLMFFYGLKLDTVVAEQLIAFRVKISDKINGEVVDPHTLQKLQEDINGTFQQDVRESWTELGK